MSVPISGQVPGGDNGHSATGGQVPPANNPTGNPAGQVPAGGAGTNPTPNPDGGQLLLDGQPFDPQRAMSLIEKLRPFEKDAETQRKRAEELEKRLKAIEEEKLTEQEKKDRELEELREYRQKSDQEQKRLRTENALTLAVAGSDAKKDYSDLVMSKLREAALEYGDDGMPTEASITTSLSAIKQKYPDLFRATPGPTPGGAVPPIPQGTTTNPAKGKPLTLETIKSMSTDEINARWEEIEPILRSAGKAG